MKHRADMGPAPYFRGGKQGWWVRCTCREHIERTNKPALLAAWDQHKLRA